MSELKDKRRYTEVVAAVETHIQYLREDTKDIKDHLDKLNSTATKHDRRITRLEVIVAICILGGGGITGILKLAGIF